MSRGPYQRDGSEDLLEWMLRTAQRHLQGVAPGDGVAFSNAIIEIEQETRLHWGGRHPYIPRRSPQERAAARKSKRDRSG